MRIHTASRLRRFGALAGLCLLAALWSAPVAVAQVSLPGTDDVESQVEDAADQVKGTVGEAVEGVKDAVEGAGGAVKGAVQDPAGAVQEATGTVTETVGGAPEPAGGTTTAASAGSSTTAASAGSSTTAASAESAARERKKEDRRGPAGDRQRRGKKSATKAENDVQELVSGGNEISGTEVAGTRIQAGGEQGSGVLSLTGAALLAYLVVGAALLSAGTVVVRWARGTRGSGRLLEGPGR